MFPRRKFSEGKKEYESFRHSWILVARSRPVVPCPENTPLPNRKQSKHMRAKILSVYMRPWTLVPEEGTVDTPYIVDLDLTMKNYHTYAAQQVVEKRSDGTESLRDIRKAWKEYYHTRVPAPFATQVPCLVNSRCQNLPPQGFCEIRCERACRNTRYL